MKKRSEKNPGDEIVVIELLHGELKPTSEAPDSQNQVQSISTKNPELKKNLYSFSDRKPHLYM